MSMNRSTITDVGAGHIPSPISLTNPHTKNKLKYTFQATVAPPLNQTTSMVTAVIVPVLIFLWLLSFDQAKEVTDAA